MITGSEHVPATGPVIFVANHPSAFMDPMVVAACIGRPTHFLAAAEYFGMGFKSWFYKKYLNMIPVYRPSVLPNETHHNEAIFSSCFELLGKGGALLVFPEGNSITEKRIRKLKTGVARMALGARLSAKHNVEVEVVPIGLNYANPHRFQSDLFINIGAPISTHTYSPENSEVVRLTDEMEERLKETILHIQHPELDSLVKKIELILKDKFKFDKQSQSTKKETEFVYQKKVIRSIQLLTENHSPLLMELERKLDDYFYKIKTLGISDGSIRDLTVFISTQEVLRLTFTLPLFLIGFVCNAMPYYATVFYFRNLNLFSRDGYEPPNKKINPAFKGSISMAIGMVFFIGYYLLLATIIGLITGHSWFSILSLALFYFAGLFCMKYIGWMILLNQKLKLRKLVNTKKDLFTSLLIERKTILEELERVTN